MDGKQHADVVAAIKAGGDDTTLLVVDPETDAFFKKCRVTPTAEHLTGTYTKHEVNLQQVSSSCNSPWHLSRWRLSQASGHLGKRVSLAALVLGFLLSNLVCPSCFVLPRANNLQQCQMQPLKLCVCMCVCLTTRLVMSEWRHNV